MPTSRTHYLCATLLKAMPALALQLTRRALAHAVAPDPPPGLFVIPASARVDVADRTWRP